eukprot:CAMPEP_0184854894 /NCGR_PEP_ID=MMETSP0580-20130426/268_1 /TAXON_ID=1118495 /ORGANISM="Dactyliosolen fragilissimus" /LENGTH=323 /DNA_ID=CAMNT_0027349259 /DNA_START=91 /DNA_END=1058 /DNA_ORIENTATION=-
MVNNIKSPPWTLISSPRFGLRIHLVRHGETKGNREGLVIGQTHSDLTKEGKQQARAAGRAIITGRQQHSYWRYYSSDQSRAKDTARLILGIDDNYNDNDKVTSESNADTQICLHLDKRLRERAKGVREGRSKALNYEEAMALFRDEMYSEGNRDESKWIIPPLETDDQVWHRMEDWLNHLLRDAYIDCCDAGGNEIVLDKVGGNDDDHHHGSCSHPPFDCVMHDTFAVSHSGTIRIAIERLVADQIPDNVPKLISEKNGMKQEVILVPNTSITTIEIIPTAFVNNGSMMKKRGQEAPGPAPWCFQWSAKLISLTNTQHLQEVL